MLTLTNINRWTSYLLLPARLIVLFVILWIGFLAILIDSFQSYVTTEYIVKTTTELLLFYSGVTVYIPQDMGFLGYGNLHKTNRFVTVFNHTHPLDILVMPMAMRRPISGIINNKYTKSSLLRQFLTKVGCKWIIGSDREDVISTIDQHFQTESNRCIVFASTPNKKLQDICASRANVVPVVISYIPSQYPINMPIAQLACSVWKILLDGHVEVWVKFLLLESYLDSPGEYSSYLQRLMSYQLSELPASNPPRILSPTHFNFRWEWLVLVCFGLLIQGWNSSWKGLMVTGGGGYLATKFPTNNTKLLYHLTYRFVQFSMLVSILSSISGTISSYFLTLL